MKASEQTLRKIEHALEKVASKFSLETEQPPLTDIYLQVKQESGELLAFDDNDAELTRCVVEEWLGNNDEDFYESVRDVIAECIRNKKELTEGLHILKPYSYVLIDDEHETVAELHLVDSDTIILSGELMEGLDEDLEKFWEELSRKY